MVRLAAGEYLVPVFFWSTAMRKQHEPLRAKQEGNTNLPPKTTTKLCTTFLLASSASTRVRLSLRFSSTDCHLPSLDIFCFIISFKFFLNFFSISGRQRPRASLSRHAPTLGIPVRREKIQPCNYAYGRRRFFPFVCRCCKSSI